MVAACQNENNGLIVFIGMWISSNKADKSGKTDKKRVAHVATRIERGETVRSVAIKLNGIARYLSFANPSR